MCYNRRLLVLIVDVSNLSNSSQSNTIELCILVFKYLVACNKSNQYFDSFASFKPILNLCIKSFVLSAYSASLIIAPTDVPLRTN